MSGQIDKEFRPLVKQLRKIDGVELRPGTKHVGIYYQGRRVAGLPSSASDFRGLRRLKMHLRHGGVPI